MNVDEVCRISPVHHEARHGTERSDRRRHLTESNDVFTPGTRTTLTIASYVIITITVPQMDNLTIILFMKGVFNNKLIE